MEKYQAVKNWCAERVGNPYIMGATGKTCTPSYRQARMEQYPAYADKMVKNCPRLSKASVNTCVGCRWCDPSTGKGKLAYDCAQLARWAMDFVGIAMVSGATSQWNKTAWAERGEIADLPRDKVALVFRNDGGKMGHVGVYQGDGTVIHAKGHDYGVVQQDLAACDFTHWGIPAGLYGEYVPELLKKGSSGEAVRQLQEMLLRVGMLLPRYGADGKYGNETAAAVLTFQAGHGLPETGECDAATWRALAQACAPDEGADGQTPVQPETPPQAPESGSTAILPPDCEAVPRLKLMEVRACLQNALNIIENALGSRPVG